MRLNDPLVTSFVYKGKEYTIDLSFNRVLDVFDVLKDEFFRYYEKADTALKILLEDEWEPELTLELWEYIFENFITTKEKEVIEYDLLGNPLPPKENEVGKAKISIEQDAELIYASFKQAYNINLFEEHGKLHWHEFRALLNGLPSNTSIQEIVRIREYKPNKHDPPEYKEQMLKLQKRYALHDEEPEEVDE